MNQAQKIENLQDKYDHLQQRREFAGPAEKFKIEAEMRPIKRELDSVSWQNRKAFERLTGKTIQ